MPELSPTSRLALICLRADSTPLSILDLLNRTGASYGG